MSNGDDVLDNWEEIDEAELTNKLQKLEKECKSKEEPKLEDIEVYSAVISTEDIAVTTTITPTVPGTMKLLQRAAQTKILPSSTTVTTPQQSSGSAATEDITSPLDDMNSTFQPVLMVLHKDADEYQSANYTQPINTQTVKILRRPTQSTEPRNNGVRPKQPIKTLQQREQEYAEARLRILGSAKNPEDDAAVNALPTTTATTSTSPNTITTSNTSAVAAAIPTTTTTTTQLVTTTNNTQSKANVSLPRNQQQQQQQPYGTGQSVYNNYYQQQQNLYYQKQQQQQIPQHQQLQHSLSSPAFGNNRLQFAATNLQQRQQFQQLQHYHQQHPQQQTWSPVVGGSVSSYTLQRQQQRQQQQHSPTPIGSSSRRDTKNQQQVVCGPRIDNSTTACNQLDVETAQTWLQQQQQQQLDILRTPRGPDGSTGFQMRR